MTWAAPRGRPWVGELAGAGGVHAVRHAGALPDVRWGRALNGGVFSTMRYGVEYWSYRIQNNKSGLEDGYTQKSFT